MGLIRIGGFPMDLVMTEGHKFPGEATDYPVEAGADISDHIRELPEEITLTDCIVSDTPSGIVATDPTRQPEPGPDGTVPLPSQAALAKLRDLKALRKPLTVETSLGAFASMAFIDLDVPVDAKRGPGGRLDKDGKPVPGALFFTATFKRVTIVSNQRTKVRVRTDLANGTKGVKAVVGKAIEIDGAVLWMHGGPPPGGPWVPGMKVETVLVQYSKSIGATHDQRVVAMRGVDPGSPLIRYFYAEGPNDGQEVTGFARLDLVNDLRRDRLLKRRKPIATSNSPNPLGVDTGSWKHQGPG